MGCYLGKKEKNMCGFFGVYVYNSQYNNYGECNCLGCAALKCNECEKIIGQLDKLDLEKLKCEKCMNCKTR